MMDSFRDFWAVVVEVWTAGILGVSLGRVLLAVGIILISLLVRRLFIRLAVRWLRLLATRSTTTFDEKIVDAFEQTIGLIPVAFGLFLSIQILELTETLSFLGYGLIKSLIIVALFWGIYNLIEPLSYLLAPLERLFNRELTRWLVRAIKGAVLFVGGAAILETWGIRVAPLLAGLGILGVAVALGAQDFFRNLIGGLLILSERRFSAGEWIHVDGVVEGTVLTINFRSTLVRRFDRAPVHVPNTLLADAALTNFSRMTHRRIMWIVGVEYRTTVDQLRKIRQEIEDFIVNDAEFADPTEVSTFVRIDSFNDSSIDILVYCFTVSTVWGEWLATKERLAYRIKEIVEGAGTAFAFPSRSLYVETLPQERPERFVPPQESRPSEVST